MRLPRSVWSCVGVALGCLPTSVRGGAKVFDPGRGLDLQNTCIMLTLLVLFTVIVDFLTEKLEEILHGHHPQFKVLVSKVYKEIVSVELIRGRFCGRERACLASGLGRTERSLAAGAQK